MHARDRIGCPRSAPKATQAYHLSYISSDRVRRPLVVPSAHTSNHRLQTFIDQECSSIFTSHLSSPYDSRSGEAIQRGRSRTRDRDFQWVVPHSSSPSDVQPSSARPPRIYALATHSPSSSVRCIRSHAWMASLWLSRCSSLFRHPQAHCHLARTY